MYRFMLLILIVLMILPGVMAQEDESLPPLTDPAIQEIADNYPLVDGSTSTQPLQMWIKCRLHDIACSWTDPDMFMTGYATFMPDWMVNFEDPPSEEIVEKSQPIYHNGTHGSYENLILKNADIILVARIPSDDELALAEENNVTLEIEPVALDAFVFLRHTDNPVENLTLDDIRAIYIGKITHWSEVSTAGAITLPDEAAISAYQRNENSGSQELMDELVMQGSPMIDAPDMILPSMIGPINAIDSDPWGIGYSVYFYASFMDPGEFIRFLAIDGIVPSGETIAAQEYALTTKVFVVIREDTPADSTARQLRDWLLAEEGQMVVAESGYVPLPLEP